MKAFEIPSVEIIELEKEDSVIVTSGECTSHACAGVCLTDQCQLNCPDDCPSVCLDDCIVVG